MEDFHFKLGQLPPEAETLREEVREFINDHLDGLPAVTRSQTWSGGDAAFSRLMGKKGWIGMTWPKQYGGGGCSNLERYVGIEELLAAGAPVFAHWIADRQSGPLLLRFGSEAQ